MNSARRALHLAGAPLRLLLIVLIHAYRVTLGGLLAGNCRFYPSCSQYAEGAIKSRGAVEGTVLAVWRLARCGPFTNGGIDPVPAPRKRARQYDAVILERNDA
jgi:putative membrane protein insertion efficiency factor